MQSKSKAERMAEHIEALAQAHGIPVEYYKSSSNGTASRKKRRIRISPVKGPVSYFVALHELGHILYKPQPPRRLEQEVAAWRWALANAEREPTPSVWRCIAQALGSYEERGRHAVWGTKLPEPGHDFWALLAEARDLEGRQS